MKLTDAIFEDICNYRNPGEIVHGAEYLKRGWMDTSDIYQLLPIIYSMTKYSFGSRKPRVLELGVSDGTSTLAFLKAIAEIDGPVVDSVDFSRNQDLASEMMTFFELTPWWKFHIKTTKDFFKINKNMYDFILIDADHSYTGAKSDWNNSLKVLNQGGIIMIHDAFMHKSGNDDGCGKLVHEIILDPNYCCFISTIPHGMAIIQRKEDTLTHYPA